jgi:hypothetical protein
MWSATWPKEVRAGFRLPQRLHSSQHWFHGACRQPPNYPNCRGCYRYGEA